MVVNTNASPDNATSQIENAETKTVSETARRYPVQVIEQTYCLFTLFFLCM